MLPPFTPGRIRESLATSLERLGMERVDLFYLHQWDEGATAPETLAACDELVAAGRVGALGLSNVTAEQAGRVLAVQAAHGFARIRAIQNNHNLAVRKFDADLLALCAREGIATVGYSPLGAGFLTGKHRGGVVPGSRFDVVPGHQRIYFQELAEQRLDRLAALAKRSGHDQARLALAWALRVADIGTILVGGRTPAHIEQAFAALALDDAGLLAELGNL